MNLVLDAIAPIILKAQTFLLFGSLAQALDMLYLWRAWYPTPS